MRSLNPLSLLLLLAGMLSCGVAVAEEEEIPLPRYMTADERARWQPAPLIYRRDPPPGPVRAVAEYEPNDGILMRWTATSSLIPLQSELITKVTTLDARAKVYLVVTSQAQQTSVTTTLGNAGADLDRVQFIIAASDSIWMRDYGPRYVIDESGELAIIDHSYNRPRPNDDQIPVVLAALWEQPRYDIGLRHGGGNYHLFDDRAAFLTNLIFDPSEGNPALSLTDVQNRYLDYQGNFAEVTAALPQVLDATRHIDMWMLPASANSVIISEYAPSLLGGVPAQVTNDMADTLSGRGYTVHRTPGFQCSGAHCTYANAVILNDLVLTCRFVPTGNPTQYAAQNAQAVAVFQQAFPGRTIDSVDCTSIISLAGAIHCIVMHVPATGAVFLFRDGFEG
jgi:agmatine/peptidylarginine deiminase